MKQLSCFKCDKKLKSAFRTNNAPPLDASVFWGGFTYGSQFDALASGKDLEINICDVCIENGLKGKLVKKVPSKHNRSTLSIMGKDYYTQVIEAVKPKSKVNPEDCYRMCEYCDGAADCTCPYCHKENK